MLNRKFGSNGSKVAAIGLGCMNMSHGHANNYDRGHNLLLSREKS